jgi:hypothetical protein
LSSASTCVNAPSPLPPPTDKTVTVLACVDAPPTGTGAGAGAGHPSSTPASCVSPFLVHVVSVDRFVLSKK